MLHLLYYFHFFSFFFYGKLWTFWSVVKFHAFYVLQIHIWTSYFINWELKFMWECGSVVASGLINFNFEVLIFLFKFVLVKQIWVHVCCTGSFGNSKIAISKPLNYHGLIQHRLKVFCLNISCLCHVRWLLSLFHSNKMFFLLNWLFITIFAMP